MYSSKQIKYKRSKKKSIKSNKNINSFDNTRKHIVCNAPTTDQTKYQPSSSFIRQPIVCTRKTLSTTGVGVGGLSRKDKSYIITKCQKHNGRYIKLKALASNAIKNNKVYTVYGGNNIIKRALNSRSWVEKIPPQNMNLSRLQRPGVSKDDINNELEKLLLSYLVEKHPPNFMWKLKDLGKYSSELNDRYQTIINKLKMDTVWASKQGLCSSIKNSKWFFIEDVSETYTPRTYSSYDEDDAEEFAADFKLTACSNLLKWLLQKCDDKELFTASGKVSLNIIAFALNRCKEFLLKKQNKDIDRKWRPVHESMWRVFLKNYYKLIDDEEQFEGDKDSKAQLYITYAKILIREMERYQPQLKCEGIRNVWIVKPSHQCRGRGIRFSSKLGEINKMIQNNQRRVVQKYIEDPLLIHETKFDIRQYYLVTSTFPLIIWMYKDCYLKFSSQKYVLKNFHESIHLTNHAVQRRFRNCQGRHSDLPPSNMWSLERYKEYLRAENTDNVWNDVIYPGMKKCIIGVMLSCQDHMSVCKNRFELFGCDFILDKEYRPWLIEINSCPDLNPTTKVTAKICSAVVEDIVKVVIDRPRMLRAGTGNFECVYKQIITVPTYHRIAELAVEGNRLPTSYFCKSSIVHEPLPSSVDLDPPCDLQATFKHLKAIYTEEPEDISKQNLDISPSEEELGQIADVITSRLDFILNELPSSTKVESNIGSLLTVVSTSDQNSDLTAKDDVSLTTYYSEADLTTVLQKPITVQMSSSTFDLPDSCGNNIEEMTGLNIAEKIIHSMSKKITYLNSYRFDSKRPLPVCNFERSIPTAPSIILNIITEKYINQQSSKRDCKNM